tara:strand:- start:357 stop:551 length:195 start_codon:yes stop_codon:yes gene_type:complete
MAKCSRCKGYSREKGECDNCIWAGTMERRQIRGPKKGESNYAKEFWDQGIKKYKKSKYGLGFLD